MYECKATDFPEIGPAAIWGETEIVTRLTKLQENKVYLSLI